MASIVFRGKNWRELKIDHKQIRLARIGETLCRSLFIVTFFDIKAMVDTEKNNISLQLQSDLDQRKRSSFSDCKKMGRQSDEVNLVSSLYKHVHT